MPNSTTVEIYIKRDDVISLLTDTNVSHILVQGSIDINNETNSYTWNIEAVGYPTKSLAGHPTCPHPCQ